MEGAASASLYQSPPRFSSCNHPQECFGALMSHYNSYQTISEPCVSMPACTSVCTRVCSALTVAAFPPVLDCLRGFRRERDLHFSVPCWRWSAGTGYNCIVLLSYPLSALICLFNIQLSTLDLEASVTALSCIRGSTSAADFSQDRWKDGAGGGGGDGETGKKKQSRKTRCENVVTETKVNKRT